MLSHAVNVCLFKRFLKSREQIQNQYVREKKVKHFIEKKLSKTFLINIFKKS